MNTPDFLSAIAAVCLALAIATPAYSVSAGYMDAVRADFDEFGSGSFQTPQDSDWLGQTEEGETDAGSLAEFDAFVKKKFRGTYILYARLPTWKKTEIWEEYVKTGDLGGIRSNIYAARRAGKKRPAPSSSISNLPFDF